MSGHLDAQILDQALRYKRLDLIEQILVNADVELFEMVKDRHQNILVRITSGRIYDSQKVFELISILINKFGIDVNFKEIGTGDELLLHNLVSELCLLSSLELVLAVDGLNINATIKDESGGDITALELALRRKNYKAAEVLIKNFADTKQLGPFRVDFDHGFAQCSILLSVLGYKFADDVLKASHHRSVAEELEYVRQWIRERAMKVLSLKELCALRIRRYASKQELNQMFAGMQVPIEMQDILFLKCYESDFVATADNDLDYLNDD